MQMKRCHRRCLAWQGGPTPLPGSLRERPGLLLLPGPQKPRWPQSLHTTLIQQSGGLDLRLMNSPQVAGSCSKPGPLRPSPARPS